MPVCRRPGKEIMIGVPTRGEIGWATVARLQEIRDAERGLPPVEFVPGHLSVAQTRNRLRERFLASDCKVLMMVDDDVVPPTNMLSITDLVPEYGMVAVPTVMWNAQHGVFLNAFDGVFRPLPVKPGTVEDAAFVGTCCVAIDRAVVEKIEFTMVGEQSDDVAFCVAVWELGRKVGVDWRTAADHHTRVSLAALVSPQ